MTDMFEGLDEGQQKAVFTTLRHVLVVAPPGSGKTLTLASRAARLLSAGNAPEAILAITFTNRAAGELKERIERLTGIKSGLNISTFHSFSLKLLKETLPGFKLIGRQESVAILKGLMRKNPEAALEKISAAKNLGLSYVDDELVKTIEAYDSELKRRNAIDLDGLLIEAVRILEQGKGQGFLKCLRHLLIDEFQDINLHQARLVGLLEKMGLSVFAIGDPDQAIYGFRGAGVEHFLDFQRDYPQAEVIRLKNNFRSGKEIVLASQAVIANNGTRLENAVATPDSSAEIRLVRCASEDSEAEFIVREIEKAMGGFGHLSIGEGIEGARFSDFAVLFRTNRQAESLADCFSRSSIPFHVAGPPGQGFWEFIEKLRARLPEEGGTLVSHVRTQAALHGINENTLSLFLQRAAQYEERPAKDALNELLDELLLFRPQDNIVIKADKVNLLTMHSSKGLEWRVVFIAGVEHGLIPLIMRGEVSDMEEERRLFYVAMTRAKERLYIISARQRRLWGQVNTCKPSPFIAEIPPHLATTQEIEIKRPRKRPVQKPLFE